MTTEHTQRSVLVIGKSQRVLDETVAGLRELGYTAEATNNFSDITPRFDVTEVDVVVFGGKVPPDRRVDLQHEIAAVNPHAVFVGGLAGIPGLIINQVEGQFGARHQDPTRTPTYSPDDRSVHVNLAAQVDVTATVWWQTSIVPPGPKSDSLVLVDGCLDAGHHAVSVPDHVPPRAAFITVRVGAEVYAFSIATER